MDIRLIAIDMDGTLLDDEKRLSERNRAALKACLDRGIYIVPATGRPAGGIPEAVCSIPGIRYGILTNGAKVADLETGKIIAEAQIGWEQAVQVLEFLSQFPAAYDPYIGGRGKMEGRFRDHLDRYGLPPAMQKLVLSTRDQVEDEIALVRDGQLSVEKINVFTADRKLRAILWERLEGFEGLAVTSSLEYNLEINAAAATKGNGLLCLAEYLGLKPEQTMAFGDGSNDLSMIQAAGLGVAMENAMEILKQQADYITGSNQEDGVASAIEHFILSAARQ